MIWAVSRGDFVPRLRYASGSLSLIPARFALGTGFARPPHRYRLDLFLLTLFFTIYIMQKYDSYKSSDIEWIGEIPSHWEEIRLGFLGDFTSSSIDKKINPDEPLVKIINYTDVYGNRKFELTSDFQYMVVSCSPTKIKEHLVKKGDLIFTPSSETKEDIGVSALVMENLENTSFSYHVLRLNFKKEISFLFKKYLCNNNFVLNFFSACSQGTTRQTLGRFNFKSAKVILPPFAEQEAIAVYLDRKTAEIDSLISDKKQLLALYEAEKTAIINNAVTKGIKAGVAMRDSGVEWLGEIPSHWGVKKLKYVAELNPSKKSSYKDSNEPVVFLPMEKVNADGTINCEIKKPAVELWNGFTYFERNDIIIAKITPCFENGKGAWLNNLETEIGFGSTEFHVLRAKSILQNYLYYITRCYDFMVIGEASMTGSAGQKRVPTEFIKEFQYAIPPLLEQAEIVSYIEGEVSRIAAKVSNVNRLISLLEEYRSALISEVVTGKVRVV
jgi:type I restriction enzyme, S subunit